MISGHLFQPRRLHPAFRRTSLGHSFRADPKEQMVGFRLQAETDLRMTEYLRHPQGQAENEIKPMTIRAHGTRMGPGES